MKKCYSGVLTASLFMLVVLGLYVIENSSHKSYFTSTLNFNVTNPLTWLNASAPPALRNPEHNSSAVSAEPIIANFFVQRNFSKEEQCSLKTWSCLRYLIANPQGFPNAVEAIKEASIAWRSLITSVEIEKLQRNGGSAKRGREKQCPHFIDQMNASIHADNGFQLRVPCGLTQGSSITVIGIPNGLLGNFRVDLTAEPLPGEPDPSIILHYNVRLHGDIVTEDPVIVQNTWTVAHDWGEEERCPSSDHDKRKKVDELDQCNELVGKENNQSVKANQLANGSSNVFTVHDWKPKKYFPFKLNDLFVATLRIGVEGAQMTVDGKHITSFAFRQTLEPWLISEVRISGDINLISVVASGLPTSEDLDHVIDLESLKAVPVPPQGQLELFVGAVSTANNFNRRMAVRRSWMQYPEVRTGKVAVRFFVGLHKSEMVNAELWNEARTYGDIQLMPFVDYYSLITWKTIAICIYGTEIVSAKFVMKTDDDAFVRVDEILSFLGRTNTTHGLLYGSISADSEPQRSPDSKWYISPEEWPNGKYPPWAHGPGYVVSKDIAWTVCKEHRKGHLMAFKLEDVAMGIWIADMKKKGLEINYEHNERIFTDGCKDGYVVAHYQGPRQMLCLWQNIQEKKRAVCCGV